MNGKLKLITAFSLVLTALVFIISPLSAQDTADPTAFLVYFDDDFELEVFDSTGEYVGDVFIGMELFPGSTIKTYNTSAEIQLEPNGSILKISENSVFQIEAFQHSADESNDFSLFNGKLRVIAARAGLGYENYSIITQSAVCGVRGTDFVIDSIGVLAVREGAVEFSSLLNGNTIDVVAGQMADVFADAFQATAMSAQSLSSIFSGMDFKGTDPTQVPGHTAAPVPDDTSDKEAEDGSGTGDEEQAVEDQPADEDQGTEPADTEGTDDEGNTADNQPSETSDTAETPAQPAEPREPPKPSNVGSAAGLIMGRTTTAGTAPAAETAPEEPAQPAPDNEFLTWLRNNLGFEIGSINIDGTTYAKAVVQPEFEFGKFRAKLYLPLYYEGNLLEPSFPTGNNEWSFGTDQKGLTDILFDVANDLFLKINYLQWGDNGDDFYFKFGNLDNMTIGHGILMRNFSNNIEFPAVRKVGINTGVNFENFGFEAVLDNAAMPTIFGGRLVYIPFGSDFPMGIGLSAITDINPDSELETTPVLWDPLILNAALDIGLPVDPLGFTIFAQAAGLTLYEASEWHTETFYNPDEPDFLTALNNYGASAGVYGDLLGLDYRLEYRMSKGIFTPSFYSNNYLVNKTAQYEGLTAFIADPSAEAYQALTMGVYGELSMNLFDVVTLGGGYLWPWQINNGTVSFDADDEFMLSLSLMPDVIPVVGIYGSFSYTRTGLVGSISDAFAGTTPFQLFDDATIFGGEIVYPFDPSLDVALQFSTAYTRDENGNLQYTDGVLDTYFAMSVDMRIHF